MLLALVAFLAGVLTVLTPCVFVVLPVILGTSVVRNGRWTPYVVVISLTLSIVLFTILLKATTLLVSVPPVVWTYLSGSILMFFGLTLVFPRLTLRRTMRDHTGGRLLGKGMHTKGLWGDVLVGAALGPVFSSCSPTYFIILATVFPLSFTLGLFYVSVYALGLALMLFLVALLGAYAVGRLRSLSNPDGVFKRTIGVLFIAIGILILTGMNARIEVYLLEVNALDVASFEYRLIDRIPQ